MRTCPGAFCINHSVKKSQTTWLPFGMLATARKVASTSGSRRYIITPSQMNRVRLDSIEASVVELFHEVRFGEVAGHEGHMARVDPGLLDRDAARWLLEVLHIRSTMFWEVAPDSAE